VSGDQVYACVLYGDNRGHWAELTWQHGLVSPPVLMLHEPLVGPVEMIHLGHPGDVVARISQRHGGRKRPVQQALAGLLGVAQQQVSQYINGRSAPSVRNWPVLVRLWFNPQLVEEKIAEIEAGR